MKYDSSCPGMLPRLETVSAPVPATAPTTKGFLFVDSPTPTLLCLAVYLVVVSVWYSYLARKPAAKAEARPPPRSICSD